jgi:hypothetical protein
MPPILYENRRTCVKITDACLYSVGGDALTTCSPAGLCDCEFSLCGMPGIWSRSKNVQICAIRAAVLVFICGYATAGMRMRWSLRVRPRGRDTEPTKAPAGQRTYTAGLCQTRQGWRKLVFNSGPESSRTPAHHLHSPLLLLCGTLCP